MWIGIISVIKGIPILLFQLIAKWDATEINFHQGNQVVKEVNYGVFLFSVLTMLLTDRMWQINCIFFIRLLLVLLLGIVNGCFLFAMVMDLKVQKVYHFVWWIAGGAAWVIWYIESREHILWLVFFWILQQRLFTRFYGKADGHAFSICAILRVALGGTMEDIWCHMIVAFGLLALVQLYKRNVDAKGKLKKPVPFIPYIWLTFWFYPGWFLSIG
ncbi:MAG: hypothetical protein II994_00750 [Lachnospiraceae bacterium]|nr:hypothetical protein [Lachnospiraceae bacterium]